MDTPDPHRPVTIASVRSELEAGEIVAALETAGIVATLTGEFTAGFRAEAPGDVEVVVKQSDVEKAATVLDELRRNSPADIDWSRVDVGEPEDD